MPCFNTNKNTTFNIKIAETHFYAQKERMARPRQKVIKQRVTLTISPTLLEASKAYAYETGESLSSLIEKLLTAVLKSSDKSGTSASK